VLKKSKIVLIALAVIIALSGASLSGCAKPAQGPAQDVPAQDATTGSDPAATAPPEPSTEAPPEAPPEPSAADIWKQRVDSWPMTFGFANNEGSELIHVDYEDPGSAETGAVTTDGSGADTQAVAPADGSGADAQAGVPADTAFDPDRFSLVVGAYGEVLPIAYVGLQAASSGNTGRDNAANFANLPGYVYSQQDWKLTKDKTYLMTEMGPLVDAMIKLSPPGWKGNTPALPKETIDSIAQYKERGVVWGKELAATANGLIGLILYEQQGSGMLFSIVYMDGEKTLFWDCPAEYNEGSTWRVDSGDEPGAFAPLFLAQFDEGLLMGLTWGAPEGENIVILYEDHGAFTQMDGIDYSRYWSP